MEVELKRLEDLSESIVNDFAYMRAREEEMRDTNGKYKPTFHELIVHEITEALYLSLDIMDLCCLKLQWQDKEQETFVLIVSHFIACGMIFGISRNTLELVNEYIVLTLLSNVNNLKFQNLHTRECYTSVSFRWDVSWD